MKDRRFLTWLHERLEYIHGENPHFDYMRKLREIIIATPADRRTSGTQIGSEGGEVASGPLWEVMNEVYQRGYEEPASGLVLHRERVILGHAAQIRALAEIIEQRGAQGLDRDPGETADWLRAEADQAEARG